MSNTEKNTNMAEIMAEIARLKAENTKLKANNEAVGTGVKLGDKGNVSLYGLGRFPVTLYGEQWTKLFDAQSKVMEFVASNLHALSFKTEESLERTVTAIKKAGFTVSDEHVSKAKERIKAPDLKQVTA